MVKLQNVTFMLLWICIIWCIAGQKMFIQDLGSFVDSAIKYDPRTTETEILIKKAQQQSHSLQNSAFLPKLEAAGVIGPAPAYTIKKDSDGESFEMYDFTHMGPFLGFEFKAYQPLTFKKLRNGMYAARCNEELNKSEVKKKCVELNQYFQELYFRYLFALKMRTVAEEAKNNLDKAIDRINNLLDTDSPDVSQNDLFELKTYRFKIEDGLYQARYGIEAAKSAMAFSLGTDSFELADSIPFIRSEKMISLDTLKLLLQQYHPDLKKLDQGIEIQRAKMNIARSEIFPEPFVAGSVTLKKAWTDKETGGSADNNLLDPFNNKEGTLGAGIRFNINVWSTKDKYLKEKLELESLERKKNYACYGLTLEMENQYSKVICDDQRLKSATVSFNAANSLLKSMVMKYDLDPSDVSGLFKAYERYLTASKDYYQCMLDCNISVAVLISRTGITLHQYRLVLQNQ